MHCKKVAGTEGWLRDGAASSNILRGVPHDNAGLQQRCLREWKTLGNSLRKNGDQLAKVDLTCSLARLTYARGGGVGCFRARKVVRMVGSGRRLWNVRGCRTVVPS
jgi:hypothetical protein